ncbi:MAG: hypothetical protein K9N49_06590 [Candidatus Marinimicrobia bacterium]|nr:hypothetical protein [Candidatus Neomarinimicrobiota bacterium]
MTSRAAWQAWRAACAVDLCDAETAAMLRRFGAVRFARLLERYAGESGGLGRVSFAVDAREAWHLLETHTQVGRTRAGKRYKDWLFARARYQPAEWLRLVEAGAELLLRDAVREYLRREHLTVFMESLHQPLGDAAHAGYTLEDLLPSPGDPMDELAEREWREVARREAACFFPTLSAPERIGLWARLQGFNLTDPDVAQWAGVAKSMLSCTHRACVERLCRHLKRAYPDESPTIWRLLAQRTLEALEALIGAGLAKEKRVTRFMKKKQLVYPVGAVGS